MVVTDSINTIGLLYDADYSSNYTDRSLVDKNYVDTEILANSIASVVEDLTPQAGGDFDMNAKRMLHSQGDDVASVINLSLDETNNGNVYSITGTETIARINNSQWQNGAELVLKFDDILLIGNSVQVSGNFAPINLAKGSDYTTVAGDTIAFRLIDDEWFEVTNTKEGGGSSGRTWRENDVDLTDRAAVNFLTNGNGTLMTDDSGDDETEVSLQFALNTDVDMTGVQDGDVVNFNSSSSKYEPISTAPFDDVLLSTEANLSADGQLSIILPAGYKIDTIILLETSSNAAGNISVGSTSLGTDIVSAVTVGADADLLATLATVYFSSVNDTDLFISSSAWGSGIVQIYFTFIKVI
jgi:hypothetical protein